MRKIRIQSVSVLLLLSLLLTGCSGNVKNYVHTDSSLKREAADALEEKYDEKFEIKEVWNRGQTMFYATCSPEANPEIVFEAEVYKDGRGWYSDNYIQALVARKIEERMEAKVNEVFGECHVEAAFYGGRPTIDDLRERTSEENPTVEYFKNLTVEEYYELDGNSRLAVYIFIDKNKLDYSKERVEKEFDFLTNIYDGEPMEMQGAIFQFVNQEKIDECKQYFAENGMVGSELSYILEDELVFGFSFDTGSMNRTFEEYDEVRREIGTNE